MQILYSGVLYLEMTCHTHKSELRKSIIILRCQGHSFWDIHEQLNEEGTEIYPLQSLQRFCEEGTQRKALEVNLKAYHLFQVTNAI